MSTHAQADDRPGLITFAAVVMFAVCFVRLITAIHYFQDGSQISDLTGSIFGDQLWVWGLWDLCLSLLALGAGLSLLVGGGFGRILGYIWAVWVIVQSFLIIGPAPWFSLAMIGLASVVIYALASTGEWREEAWSR
jgi:hypothetical protein